MSGGRFPRTFIDRVLATIDVEAVIGRYTRLKRKGNRLFGLCPFHQEKTPSFSVDPEQGLYYCFGCHAGGSIFDFVMEMENVNFPESVEFLAREAGLEIPEGVTGSSGTSEPLYDAADYAARFFRKALKSDEGKEAREYLKGRGISRETWKKYLLGWAPADQMHLPGSASKSGRSPEPFEKIALFGKANSGKYFSRIDDALVFPISRPGGRIAGFAHRRIREDENRSGPKYINSADNDIYHKSNLLYGLTQARSGMKSAGHSLLVEGYFDVLALAERGFDNAVATCGTALTEAQARLLVRYCREVVLLFDGDEAGHRATLRSLEILLAAGADIRVVRLPEDEDPDSFVDSQGQEKLEKIITSAPGWFDWLYRLTADSSRRKGVSRAVELADAMADPLAAIPDRLTRDMYVRELATRLGSSEEALREHLRRSHSGAGSREKPGDESEDRLPDNARLELALVAAAIKSECPKLTDNPLTLYPGLWDMVESGVSPNELLASISDSRAKSCISELLLKPEPGNETEHMFCLLNKIRRKKYNLRLSELSDRLRDAESGGREDEAEEIMTEMAQLVEKLGTARDRAK